MCACVLVIKKKERLPFCTEALIRSSVGVLQTTRVCTCADGDPNHPDIPSASPPEENKNKQTNTFPTDTARHLPLTFFVLLLYLPVSR